MNKWYYRPWALVISFLMVGPLMLPLVWRAPQLSRTSKVSITVAAIVFTVLLVVGAAQALKILKEYYQPLLG